MLKRIPQRNHITPVLRELHWLRIHDRIISKNLLLTHKADSYCIYICMIFLFLQCVSTVIIVYTTELVSLYTLDIVLLINIIIFINHVNVSNRGCRTILAPYIIYR